MGELFNFRYPHIRMPPGPSMRPIPICVCLDASSGANCFTPKTMGHVEKKGATSALIACPMLHLHFLRTDRRPPTVRNTCSDIVYIIFYSIIETLFFVKCFLFDMMRVSSQINSALRVSRGGDSKGPYGRMTRLGVMDRSPNVVNFPAPFHSVHRPKAIVHMCKTLGYSSTLEST
jgi:hypothetical protein